MRFAAAATAIAVLLLSGCESRKEQPKPQAAGALPAGDAARAVELGDLSASLDAVRTAFNAHKGEARFLTLLSPT